MKAFCDTNVLVYAYSITEPIKAEQANRALFAQPTVISTQVINEFVNVGLRKLKLTETQLQQAIIELTDVFTVVTFSPSSQLKALSLKQRYQLQYYDSLILATSLENNCDILYSEDMQHGMMIDGKMKVVNPFL